MLADLENASIAWPLTMQRLLLQAIHRSFADVAPTAPASADLCTVRESSKSCLYLLS
jgi:hypothetical protein